MTEKVLATVRAEGAGFSADMELPALQRIEYLAAGLLESLKRLEPAGFAGVDAISLHCDGRRLRNDASLAAEAVWDGKILDVRW
jgi:hypothetical protein